MIDERLKEFTSYSELKQMAYALAGLQVQKMFHSLAVLSFLPGEGKTLFCAALAMAYAEARRSKVLVIDTTTFQNKGSLVLKKCLSGALPMVEVLSLEELRKGSDGNPSLSSPDFRARKGPSQEPEIVPSPSLHMSVLQENDLSLIKNVSADRSKQYGLVLLDTTPLNAKNKGNMDPLVVAHLCDASVLVVSRKFLDAPNVNTALKALEDPSLRLLGMISNEAYSL